MPNLLTLLVTSKFKVKRLLFDVFQNCVVLVFVGLF